MATLSGSRQIVGSRHGAFHPLTVAAVERLTDDAVALTFAVPDHLQDDYTFEPGQHLTLRSDVGDGEVRRTYSICSSAPSRRLRVAVKRLAGGAFSGHATSVLQVGDTIEVMTPSGRFTPRLDAEQARHYGAIAAGSGITPILSIVASVLEVEPASRVSLVYGNRSAATVMFLDELAELKDRYPQRLHVVHVLSREPQDSELLSGRLDQERLRRVLDALVPVETVDVWFLCGPQGLVEGAREVLVGAGADPATVHAELFHVEGEVPRPVATVEEERAAGTSTVLVTLDGRRSTVTVPRTGVRVLDAVLAVRADAPYACKGGVCGTCRARVVTGEVDMARNYALDVEEIAAGFVLACQAVPVSEAVELDFDA